MTKNVTLLSVSNPRSFLSNKVGSNGKLTYFKNNKYIIFSSLKGYAWGVQMFKSNITFVEHDIENNTLVFEEIVYEKLNSKKKTKVKVVFKII